MSCVALDTQFKRRFKKKKGLRAFETENVVSVRLPTINIV